LPKRKCDECDKPATHHSVEIIKGEKIEKHLCDECAADQGLVFVAKHAPINELLSDFVKMHSGATDDIECDLCGLVFSEFREHSLLGCPGCYLCHEEQLTPLVERAQEGATHHIGKVPQRAGADEVRQQRLLQLRKNLTNAIEAEDYETAARLRDEVQSTESRGTETS
jgi:protein arginine kinase activator